MDRGRAAAALFVLALALGGCSGGLDSLYKPPPPPEANLQPKTYRQDVAELMRTYVDNPVKIRDAFISEPAIKPYGGGSYYVSCVRYNPQDFQGKYQGNTERMAIFLGGRINQFLPSERTLCGGAVYQKFPEVEALVP